MAGDGLADALLAALPRAAVLVSPAGLHWHKQAIVRGDVSSFKLTRAAISLIIWAVAPIVAFTMGFTLPGKIRGLLLQEAHCGHLSPSTQTLLRHRL